jgi:membrane-bound lytic murein transglycosylase B
MGGRYKMKVYILFFILLISTPSLQAENYNSKPNVQKFIKKMNKDFNYKTSYLKMLFSHVRKNPYIPRKKTNKLKNNSKKKISTKKRKKGSWDQYSALHLEQNRTKLGAKFMLKHKKILKKASKIYGIPPEYITAIIGIESYYGANRGRYYVFDQLSHLAFGNHKRKKLYRYELQEFLRMCYREKVEPRAVKGSASGAIGLGQFLPSNYKRIVVDFNGDGKKRMNHYHDAIASIANYFKLHGWRKNEPIAVRVKYKGTRFHAFKTGLKYKYERKNLKNIYPRTFFNYKKKVMLIKLERETYDELWYATKNFYVLTRYNHSSYYAMAVHQLANKIKKEYKIKNKK